MFRVNSSAGLPCAPRAAPLTPPSQVRAGSLSVAHCTRRVPRPLLVPSPPTALPVLLEAGGVAPASESGLGHLWRDPKIRCEARPRAAGGHQLEAAAGPSLHVTIFTVACQPELSGRRFNNMTQGQRTTSELAKQLSSFGGPRS